MSKYEEALNYFLDREEGDNITVTCDWLMYAEELKDEIKELRLENARLGALVDAKFTEHNWSESVGTD